MAKITITEALAELHTIEKRIAKKQAFVYQYLTRHESLKDPLGADGASRQAVAAERQAIRDLHDRHVAIRTAIARVNLAESMTVLDETRTIYEWLVWKREIAPKVQDFLNQLAARISTAREPNASPRGRAAMIMQQQNLNVESQKPMDVTVNIDEKALAVDIERLEQLLGVLDGMLSLKNATLMIDV